MKTNGKFRTKTVAISVIAALAMLCAFTPAQIKNSSDVRLENIEALSSSEELGILCFGDGTIDCNGGKYEIKIIFSK